MTPIAQATKNFFLKNLSGLTTLKSDRSLLPSSRSGESSAQCHRSGPGAGGRSISARASTGTKAAEGPDTPHTVREASVEK